MEHRVHRLVDSLARDSASRLVAALARRLGAGRIAVAEDAVQHALMQALSLWPFKGVPDRPEAWLSTVARNRALDLLRGESRSLALAEELVPLSPASEAGEKSCACQAGNSAPMAIGPSIRPAAISPTTAGWPRWRSSQPQARAVPRMRISCKSSAVTDISDRC